MSAFEITIIILGILLTTVVLAAMVWSAIWVGRDARERGLRPVWLLQVLMLVQFPWPLLAYWLITRNMDRMAAQPQRV
jgi:hypothetical protein